VAVRKVKDWRSKPRDQLTRGERNALWVETFCRVPEGKFRGQPVRMRDWQVHEFRKIYDSATSLIVLSFPRKNGKTALISFIVLLHTCGPEAEIGSEIVSGARSRDQAGMVFRYAAKCARLNHDLRDILTIRDTAKEIACHELQTLYKALSADAETNIGRSPKLAIHDELGQVKGPRDAFYEAIDTAQGAHDDPLTIVISTQAPTSADLLSVIIDDALTGKDPTIKASLYTAPEDMDPFSEEALKVANPAFGDFLNAETTRKSAEKARRMPSREAAYRNLILNQRVNLVSPLLSRMAWEACGGAPGRLEGRVYLGLDLSAIHDLTAAVAVAEDSEGQFAVHPTFFTPLNGLKDRADRDREPYDVWHKQGFLQALPGFTIDIDAVAMWLVEFAADHDLAGVWFDRWRIDTLKAALLRISAAHPELAKVVDSIALFPFGQGFKDMTPAVQKLETVVAEGRLRHGMHPVLTMCARNAVAVRDAAGGVKLDKSKATGRIDGLVALAMALGGAALGDQREAPKSYQMMFV
jgi:phage terminase large subunit-like protein